MTIDPTILWFFYLGISIGGAFFLSIGIPIILLAHAISKSRRGF